MPFFTADVNKMFYCPRIHTHEWHDLYIFYKSSEFAKWKHPKHTPLVTVGEFFTRSMVPTSAMENTVVTVKPDNFRINHHAD